MKHICRNNLLVIWFIFSLENLYHLACHIIYIPTWGICIILLIMWFIFPSGEFVSSCSSYDLYSRLENLYHLARRMIYILAWGICIICCWKDSLTLCCFGPSWGHVDICIKLHMHLPRLGWTRILEQFIYK